MSKTEDPSATSDRDMRYARSTLVTLTCTVGVVLCLLVASLPSCAPLSSPESAAILRVATANIGSSNRYGDAVAHRLANSNANLLVLLECTHTNDDNPQTLTFGLTSEEEMCIMLVYYYFE